MHVVGPAIESLLRALVAMYDSAWLFNAPAFANAIEWSDDNHLAVAAEHSVVILNPGNLKGPRAYLGEKDASIDALECGCMPAELGSNFQFLMSCATEVRSEELGYKARVRSLSWSPVGFTPQGGCLLVTVTSDHLVSCRQALYRNVFVGSECSPHTC